MIDKKKSNLICVMILAGNMIIPSIGYADGVDAYYDGNYFVIQDYNNCKLSINKNKFKNIKDDDIIEIELDGSKFIIDRKEMDRLIELADKHDKELFQNTILASGLCGGTLIGGLGISNLLKKKLKWLCFL